MHVAHAVENEPFADLIDKADKGHRIKTDE